MHIVLLKFSENKAEADRHMSAHRAWLKRGFDDGVFLLAGSLQPGLGGGILVHGITDHALRSRLDEDPFVTEKVVTAEILALDPALTDPRLAFLKG